MLWSSFFSFLVVAECRLTGFKIEENDEKSVDPALAQVEGKSKKTDENSFFNGDSRFKPVHGARPNGKIENDKVVDLFGKQNAQTNSEQGQVYRITCWEQTSTSRAGCIYQAPNEFKKASVTHFWLASTSHRVRWIHFYDANVIPSNSKSFQDDYAITHTNTDFEGIDFVNFIVMFERVDQMAPSIPSDSDWIVYSDAEEFWDAALFSFPSNYDGNRARSYIQAQGGAFHSGNVILIQFPAPVKDLHFDELDGLDVQEISYFQNFVSSVMISNITPGTDKIWFDFEYLDALRDSESKDPSGNWFDASKTIVTVF
ncbi:Oidioi.mRNA.OKI2018_I69.XSR.g14516.t1.cds [Oikopleura dioica]|uniref:Oidioi.mRNA.OKI2018_I69.XSR.g14516.t1.cds n=1 Tax=Oikopleura dioica TaxID=34765 RepID=A0ABN7SGC1_OIKDI|nr:Oidioi.mRNA.OKI2018_I69.XSR.g14516.t1.cds [Oikopleura dioica]